MKHIVKIDYEYNNQEPCHDQYCSESKRRPCKTCGRSLMRGKVIIQTRQKYVYLERLTNIFIEEHNNLPFDLQESSTLFIWLEPQDIHKETAKEKKQLEKIKEKKKLKK